MHGVQLVAPEEVEASVIAEAESNAAAREAERVEKLRGRYEHDVEKARTALNRAIAAALVDPQKVETARAKLQAAETQLRMLGEERNDSGEVLQRVADEDEGDRAVRMGEATPFAAAASASAVAAPQRVARPKMQAPVAAAGQAKKRLRPLGKEKKRRSADGSDDEGDDGQYDPDKDSGEDVDLYEPIHSSDGENGVKKEEVEEEGEGVAGDAAEAEEDSGVDVTFEGGFSVTERLYERLFAYQQVGLRWLWELHRQRTGGIVADEMGLGKTIQIIAFLGGLHHSKLLNAPLLVVCPATVLRQWARECSVWWPRFLASGMHPSLGAAAAPLTALRDPDFMRVGRLVITTYECVRQNEELFLAARWHYVILDEGHRIRNPNAETTLTCKQFATPHRLLLTGAPVQNNLRELWSLFDFIFPGKLGTLPVFETEFGLPIALGGYSNASPSQLHTAYRCASALRDIIRPYLLRRMKADVNARLPKKTEQVLFCSLTDVQRAKYRDYVRGPDISAALEGRMHALKAIDHLRKVCNHPHLLLGAGAATRFDNGDMEEEEYGAAEMSGKMQVLKQLLPLWREQGHRALLFSQTRQMLDILERLTRSLGLPYRRMDGNTAIGTRMSMIDEYNNDTGIFVFLLTTKVGGLGINLTGADRVLIFDPDWNPTVDTQARERAWRIGQQKEVTVYRLITRGTIEEKIYHRQIFKQFLSNKVLRNPKQRRLFRSSDLRDLFSFDEHALDADPETAELFPEAEVKFDQQGQRNAERRGNRANGRANNLRRGDSEKEKESSEGAEADRLGLMASVLVSPSSADDAAVVRQLLGVSSRMEHDAIMDRERHEPRLVEVEAERVAARAAAALRADQQRIGRGGGLTWTGSAGNAGMPSVLRGGAASRAVLSAIDPNGAEQHVLLPPLISFLQARGGVADSESIVEAFKARVPPSELAVFRQLLRQVATFDARKKSWRLMDEFARR